MFDFIIVFLDVVSNDPDATSKRSSLRSNLEQPQNLEQPEPADKTKKTNPKVKLPGISRDKTMTDKLMYIPNDDTQNYPFCRLKLVVETFEHST